jgi:uncharacterized RDD family membrane protein YckC
MVEQRYQTFGRRVVAYFLDRIPFYGLERAGTLLYLHFGSVYFGLASGQFLTWAWIAYRVLAHGFWGQTFGKKICKLRVVDLSGQRLSMRQALLREIVPIVLNLASLLFMILNLDAYESIARGGEISSRLATAQTVYSAAMIVWWLAQLVILYRSDKQRAIHDYIAGSVVLRLNVQEAGSGEQREGAGGKGLGTFERLGRPGVAAIAAVMAAMITLIFPTLFVLDGEICPGYKVNVLAYYGKLAPLTLAAAVIGAVLGGAVDWSGYLRAGRERNDWRLGCGIAAVVFGGVGLVILSCIVAIFPGC